MVGNNRANSTTCVLAGEAAVPTRTGHPGSSGDMSRAKVVAGIHRLDVLTMSRDLRTITPENHGEVVTKVKEFLSLANMVRRQVDSSVKLFAENTRERRSYENVQTEVERIDGFACDLFDRTWFVRTCGPSNAKQSMRWLESLKRNCTMLARAVSRARRIG